MSIFYGWKISAVAAAGNFMIQGSTLYCMNAFMQPLCEMYGWSRMGLNFSMGIATLAGQIAMPAAAIIAEKMSMRFLMALTALLGGVASIAMGFTSSLPLYTFFFVLVWVSSQFCGGVLGNALVSNWFHHKRGLAYAIVNGGTSLAGMLLPFCMMLIINSYNVPIAYTALGLGACLLAPLSWIVVRRTPAALGLHPDGANVDPPEPAAPDSNFSYKNLFHNKAAWIIGLAFGLALMVGSGMVTQLKPRFSDLGYDDYTAMLLTSLVALGSTAAKYIWGYLCDKMTPLAASRLIMICCISSMLLLLLPPTFFNLMLFCILFSIFSGGMWVLLPAIISWYFGGDKFLGVFKFVSLFLFFRCVGFPIMGISHEFLGHYGAADIAFTGSYVISLVLVFMLRPDKAAEYQPSQH